MNRVPDADGTTRTPSVLPPRFPLPRATTINFWLFWVAAFLTLISPSGIERFMDFSSLGTTRFIALGWLAVAFTARASPMGSLGKPGTLFLATIALYMIIGTSVSSYNDAHFVFHWRQKYSVLGMLVVAATATGVVDAASRIGAGSIAAECSSDHDASLPEYVAEPFNDLSGHTTDDAGGTSANAKWSSSRRGG